VTTGTLPGTNRVAVYYSNTDLRMETRPMPRVGAGELLIEVRASGICGSDVMEWYRRASAPSVLGHEIAGSVVAAGDGVAAFTPGDRIVVTHHVPCMVCRYCRTGRHTMCDMLRRTSLDPGGFAQYVRVPAVNVERGALALPAHVSWEAGSMVEPLACTLRGQLKAGLASGDTVLILGAGVSGCLHLLAAQALGAARIIVSDICAQRRVFAESLGADLVLDGDDQLPERVRGSLGHQVDRVIVCTGDARAIAQAIDAVDRGGVVLFFAPMGADREFPLPFDKVFWRDDRTLTSSYGAGLTDLSRALALIESGRIDVTKIVTHRLPLREIQTGFDLMTQAGNSLKIVLDPMEE
jgi:L-iditol 2-dehydrogenase